MKNIFFFGYILIASIGASPAVAEQWRGLTVSPENRCAPYNKW